MINEQDSLYSLIEVMKQKAPAYFKLLAAKSESEFDEAFDTMLEGAVSHLEVNSKNYESLNEVALTGVLAASLSVPGLTVTQETHSNGHVDLTIVADHCMPARNSAKQRSITGPPITSPVWNNYSIDTRLVVRAAVW